MHPGSHSYLVSAPPPHPQDLVLWCSGSKLLSQLLSQLQQGGRVHGWQPTMYAHSCWHSCKPWRADTSKDMQESICCSNRNPRQQQSDTSRPELSTHTHTPYHALCTCFLRCTLQQQTTTDLTAYLKASQRWPRNTHPVHFSMWKPINGDMPKRDGKAARLQCRS